MKAAFFTHPDAHRPNNQIDYVYAQGRQAMIAEQCDLHPVRITPENFYNEVDRLQDLDVIFSTWGMFELTPEQLALLPNLKAVFYAAGTVKFFAGPMLERGIRVSSANAANAIPVAEFCLAQILLSCKRYFRNTAACREHIFDQKIIGQGVYGETVALIGIGAISRHLLKLLAPYNLHVIAVSNYLSKNPELAKSMGIHELVSVEAAFERGYVVSNHLPNLESNQQLFQARHFRAMRQGATFINTGRGAQVHEADLIEVMRERADLTALLDVTFPEPPPSDSPLFDVPNIHLSAHIAGSQNDEVVRMADCAIAEFQRFQQGAALEHEVWPKEFGIMA